MGGYLANFAIYIMAMLGLIFFALLVYQKVSNTGTLGSKKSNFLRVEETMSIGARKNLYVVRAGSERFLIASDMDKTSLIAKLNADNTCAEEIAKEPTTAQYIDELYNMNRTVRPAAAKKVEKSVDDIPVIVDFQEKKTYGSNKRVLHDMMRKING